MASGGRFLGVGALAWCALALFGCSSGSSGTSPQDTVPPTVVSTSPAAGATDVAPEGASVSVTFSEAMDPSTVNGSTFVLRDPGGALLAGSVGYIGTAATFTPSTQLAWLTTYTATIAGAKDLAGNALSPSVSWSFTTAPAPDTTAPSVVSYTPASNAIGVSPYVQVTVTFSEPMEAASTAAAISLSGPGGAVPASVAVVGATATLTPAARLSDVTTYTATVTTAALDLAGNALAYGLTWSFTTADATPPSVTSVYPPSGATNVDVGAWMEVLFSEQVDGATVTSSTLQVLDDQGSPVAGTIDFGGNAASFFPAAALKPGTTYTLVASTGITDLAGNPLASSYSSAFTTTGTGTGSWTATAAPSPLEPYAARAGPSAVWTGSELIVWGGWYTGSLGQVYALATGGRYSPSSNAWQSIPSNLPNTPAGRFGHATVWTGSRMIVWGGNVVGGLTAAGGAYDPSAGASGGWTATQSSGAPEARADPVAVWTGTEMIVWGGWNPGGVGVYYGTGGRYALDTDTWTAMAQSGAPTPRVFAAGVWTGSRLLVWGGMDAAGLAGDGAAYDPGSDTWEAMAGGGPSARWRAAAVWTGTEMIVWGGSDVTGPVNDGAAYDPVTRTWSAISATGAPPPRERPSAVWTGSRMIAWGGGGTDPFTTQTGGIYDPTSDAWSLTALAGAPSPRMLPAAVWTGTEMIVWGGWGSGAILEDGARYGP